MSSSPARVAIQERVAAPRSRSEMFWAFTWLALQGFGGVMAVVQRELVDKRRWMTREQFVEEWSVAQTLPGPNAIILVMAFGARHSGLPGAIAAIAGMLVLPLLLVLVVAVFYASMAAHPQVQGALRGMGAVAAGLVLGTGLRLASALRNNPMGLPASGIAAVTAWLAVVVLHWSLVWVLLCIGGTSCLWAWHRIRQQRAAAASAESPAP